MSRRYKTDVYDDRRSEVMSNGGRRGYYEEDEEIDIRTSTRPSQGRDNRRSQPDFLRDDYARTSAGPLVVRDRERDFDDTRSRRSHAGGGRSEIIDKEEVSYRGRGDNRPPPPQERDFEEFYYRHDSRGPPQPAPPPPKSSRSVRGDETDIYIRHEERDGGSVRGPPSRAATARPPPSKAPPRSEYDTSEEIRIRRGEADRRSVRGGGDDHREKLSFRRSETELVRPGREREVEKEEFVIRRSERDDRHLDVEKEEFIFRRSERDDIRSRGPTRAGDFDQESSVSSRPRERSLPPPRSDRGYGAPQLVAREREDFVFRRARSPSPPAPIMEREQITFRRREPSLPPPPQRVEREEITFRHREVEPASPIPPRRETEEITFRRREAPRGRSRSSSRSSSPSRFNREEIIIRRTERSPSPVLQSPPPPPALDPIIRPPIHQEIITHHRHIDHGFERPRSPSPPPPPPSPPREEKMEIAIRTKQGTRSNYHEEEIRIERGGSPDSPHSHHTHHTRARSQSRGARSQSRGAATSRPASPARSTRSRRHTSGTGAGTTIGAGTTVGAGTATGAGTSTALTMRRTDGPADDIAAEAEYYSRRAAERSYPGEAYNGATKDWAIVDVPPGTNRVRMDGVGGGSQEITWQRYNGVRRSKFLTDGQEYDGDFGRLPPSRKDVGPPVRSKAPDMWTEITKDLVLKEAIDTVGYDYEETDFFFYVMEYLRYEDVLQLVELSDNIRRNRRNRIREIEWEREQLERERMRSAQPVYDERIYEREIVYDRDRRHR